MADTLNEPKRNITSDVSESIVQKSDSVFLPILIDIKHPGIVWNYPESKDPEILKLRQQDGHLRLVNDTRGLIYKGNDPEPHYYDRCNFSVKMPKEDGKQKGNASISISVIDHSLVEIIREIEEDLVCRVVGMYSKVENSNGSVKYAFTKLYGREFDMGSVTWEGATANWELDPDRIMDLNVPKDMATAFRLSSMSKE